jgi:uncharacterized protein (TIGR00730 family)
MTDPQLPNDQEPRQWLVKTEPEQFLAGPDSFFKEILRLSKIIADYIRGFYAFRDVHRCVTVFGSARFPKYHRYYQMAYDTGYQLAMHNFTVMTGGGPGVMEAANHGAKMANGKSIGCSIKLVREEKPNHYLDKWITFKFFFIRKMMLTKYSLGFVVLPGGFGTMDELFEMATLIQTGKIKNFPVVLMGKDFWQPLIKFMSDYLVANGTITDQDIHQLTLTDSPQEAVEFINAYIRNSSKK